MANPLLKYPENVEGTYFVDTECIACDTCVGLAQKFFSLTADNSHAYVHTQPKTPQEVGFCEEALIHCPVQAIGKLSCA